jgi:hypothetical protein
MTIALKKVMARIHKMSVSEQNAIAALLTEELAWEKSYSKSQDELEFLASEAIVEYKKGKTRVLKLK